MTPVLYLHGNTTKLFNVAPHRPPPPPPPPQRSEATPEKTPPPEIRPEIRAAELRTMYIEARTELRAKRYDTAIGLLDDLLSLDSDYRDASALRATAVRQRDLADTYQRAVGAQNCGEFSTALRLYTEVLDTEPDYQEAVTRRQQCKTAERIADLQDQLRHHADVQNWQAVIEVSDELAALDPEAADPDGLATRARNTVRAAAELGAQLHNRARAAEDAGDWATAISHYSSLRGYRDAEIRLHTCQQRQEQAKIATRRQAELANRYAQGVNHLDQQEWRQAVEVFATIEQEQPGYRDAAALLATAQRQRDLAARQSSLGIPATLIAVAGLTGAVPPIYLLSTNYPVDTDEIWHWQTASRILIGVSFCFLAWMAKSRVNRRAMLSAALMVPVIVLHVVNGRVLARDDLETDAMEFLNNVAYPTILALAAMVGILFGVAVIRKYRVSASVLIAWGVCGLLEAFLSYEAKIAPWRPGEPPVEVWKAADSVLVVQNLILLAVAVIMFLESRPAKTNPRRHRSDGAGSRPS